MGRVGAAMRGTAIAEGAHDLFAAGHRGDRIAIGHRLGEGGDVGLDAMEGLNAALGDAEAGLHLVDDQQHAIFVAELARELDEFGRRRDGAAIAHHRLDQHGADRVAVLLEDILEPVGIVHRVDIDEILQRLRDAAGIGDRLRIEPAARIPLSMLAIHIAASKRP